MTRSPNRNGHRDLLARNVPGLLRQPLWVALFPAHLIFALSIGDLRPEHVGIDALGLTLALLGERTRAFMRFVLPVWFVGVAYDNLDLLLGWRPSVHVADVFAAELRWFGIDDAGSLRIPADYFSAHSNAVLDLLCGFAYLAYLYQFVAVAAFLFFKNRAQGALLVWSFLLVNLAGMVTYLVFPTAPPWYVAQYGLGPAILDAAPSAAGAARFDQLLGIDYFGAFYARNANVFGAIPSLHVAYPTLAYLAVRKRSLLWALSSGGFALLVGFAAIYLQHHYVIDILLGYAFAAAAYALTAHAMQRQREPNTIDAPATPKPIPETSRPTRAPATSSGET